MICNPHHTLLGVIKSEGVKLILKHSTVIVFTSCSYTLLDRAVGRQPFESPYSMPFFLMWVSVEKVALQLVFFSEFFGLPL
jgi:hypothetical protein